MQTLGFSETAVKGPRTFTGLLAQPKAVQGFYRDVAVLAVLTPAAEAASLGAKGARISATAEGFDGGKIADGDPETGTTFRAPALKDSVFISIEFPEQRDVGLLNLQAVAEACRADTELQVSDDGKTFKRVTGFGGVSASRLAFRPEKARYWRLAITTSKTTDGTIRIQELRLTKVVPVPREGVVDLSGRMQPDGKLSWDVPEGEWTVFRIGHTSTGAYNKPAVNGAAGWNATR